MAARQIAKPLANTPVFTPLKIGDVELKHRIAHLPCTRYRASNQVPSDLQLEYYSTRAKVPGTLIIAEATNASEQAGNSLAPGIWTDQMVSAWKKITDEVHKQGSFMSLQIWHMGRAGEPGYLKKRGHRLLGPSVVQTEEKRKIAEKAENPLTEMTQQDIDDVIYNQFAHAAKNALRAGFDFVELHLGNGYLFEQFLYSSGNKRTDKYGGSIENNSRILLELVDHLLEILPPKKLAIRINPYIDYSGFEGLKEEISPIETYSYVLDQLQSRADAGRSLAYIDLVNGTYNSGGAFFDVSFARQHWSGPIILGGNYSAEEERDLGRVLRDVGENVAIGFGRNFLANPDLVERLKHGHPVVTADRATFYKDYNLGYNTYGAHERPVEYDAATERKRRGIKLA